MSIRLATKPGARRESVTHLTGAAAAVERLEERRLLAASIEVTDISGGIPIADGDNSPAVEDGTDFGAVPVGSARPFHSFRVTNTSTADDLALGGLAAPAGFRLEKNLPAVLAPGGSDVFTISLLDDSQSTREGSVTFNTNVPGSEVFDFAVSGVIVSAAAEPDNIFEDVPSFTDSDSVSFQGGTDPDGVPVDVPVTRLLRFNVPAGQAQVAFTLTAELGIAEGATADAELIILRDADGDQELDVAELAAPVAPNLVAPPNGSQQSREATLTAATYFAFLRPANVQITDGTVDQPGVRVDYTLGATITAVAAPGVAVTFAGTSVPDGDTSPSPDEGTDFGSVQVGQPAPQRTFTVTNNGSATLNLGSVSVSGPFQVVTALPASIAPGASANLVMSMSTATVGGKSGALSFPTNVEGKDPYNFDLEGNVTTNPPPTAPEITVSLEAGGGALVDGQAAVVEFGTSVQGQAGATRRFIVRNDGNAALALGEVVVPAGFSITEPLTTTLTPGASDGFTVTVDTGSVGERTGTLSIPTNDADENPFNFNIRGTVGLPGSTATPDITLLLGDDPLAPGETIDFGAAAAGTAPPARTITLRNDGTAALALGTISVPAGYVVDAGPALTTLVPTASTTVRISLATGTAGTFSGQAAVASNDPDESPFALNLSGVVTQPAEPSDIDLRNVTGKVPPVVIAGAARARGSVAFTVTNTGSAPFASPVTFTALASNDTQVGGSDVELVSVTRNVRLKAGASRVMRLKFRFPPTFPGGEKNILVTAAADRTLDTEAGPQVSVQEPFIRLTGLPSAVPAARPLTFGKRFTFLVPLQNVGNVSTARTPATYTLIVTRDGTESTEVFRTTATGRVNLKPSVQRPQRVPVTFQPASFPAGTYTLIVRLSADLNQTNGDTVALIPFTIA